MKLRYELGAVWCLVILAIVVSRMESPRLTVNGQENTAIVLSTSTGTSNGTCLIASYTPVHWSVVVKGGRGDAKPCPRCKRLLAGHTDYSGEIIFANDDGKTFFDGCMKCLEDTVAPEHSAR